MAVPKWRRSSSKLNAFYEAVKLHQIITQMVMRPDRGNLTREHRKLGKLKGKLEDGLITYPEIEQQFKSWRGYVE